MKYKSWIILSFLFLPIISFATSGACSGHGGVSCSSGSDYDGSVICADGWRNSSVSYSSMSMCKTKPTYIPTCYEPTKQNFNCDTMAGIAALSGLSGSSADKTPQCIINQTQADIKYQEEYVNYKKCFMNLGYNIDTQQIVIKDIPVKPVLTDDEKCQKQYSDSNSHAEKGQCVCNTGYVLYKNDGVCELKKVEVVPTQPNVISTQIKTETPKIIPTPKVINKPIKKIETPKVEIKEEVIPTPTIEEPKIEQTKIKPFYKRLFNWLFK